MSRRRFIGFIALQVALVGVFIWLTYPWDYSHRIGWAFLTIVAIGMVREEFTRQRAKARKVHDTPSQPQH